MTHDQIEAMTMGTRIAVMKDGLLQQIDTPQTLYDHPTNIFVAGFIGSPAMNFFDVTVKGKGTIATVDGETFQLVIPGEAGQRNEANVGKAWHGHSSRGLVRRGGRGAEHPAGHWT